MVERALSAAAGRACLDRVFEGLSRDLQQNRFSRERAVRAYASAIDKAVWSYLQDSSLRRIIYRNYLIGTERSAIIKAVGEEVAKLGPQSREGR